MTGIWSTIKAAAPALSHQHETTTSRAADTGSNARSSSPPRNLGTPPSSRSLPRPPSSLDARGTTRGHTSTASPQSHSRSPGTRSPARLSRNSTSTALKEKGRGKDKETEPENADRAPDTTATLAAASSDNTGDVDVEVARPTPPPAHTPGANSAIDPLSQHIFMRKNTEPSIPQRLTQMAEGIARASSELSRNVVPANELPKDKRLATSSLTGLSSEATNNSSRPSSKKGSSFLSRLSIRSGRKKELGDLDSDSELGSEVRMDGINAHVFSQTLGGPVTGGGYVPHHKEPPRYIRTRATNKRSREFNRMFLAQELVGTCPPEKDGDSGAEASGRAPVVTVSVAGAGDRKTTRTGGAIWATEFSKDGRYLATAGRDHVVRIWAVLSTPEERRSHEEDEAGGAGERLSAPVFRDQPVKEFRGHTGEVLDLSWSKNNFLLSSSMDKTVRLWHMSRSECLCTFKHKDFVTRLAFHPRDDRFFLAGSLDTMLRLWSIPDQAVAFSAQLPDLVTAVAFSPDGKVAIAGLLNGLCMFYETEGLKLSSQIHVRSSRGKNAKGSKITGIQTMVIPPARALDTVLSQPPGSATASVASTEVASTGEVRVLITSNDSRIRIYSLRDKSLDVKLKGHENLCSQIAATFSDDGKYVICGSEDRKAFLWSLTGSDALVPDKDKSPCEYFEAHGDIVTTALFAPTKTRMLLGQSGDPIYDLCNPPPVVLQSLEEAATSAAASQTALTHDSSLNHHAGAPPPPSEPTTASIPVCKKPEPSPAYIARSTHYDGNIIVTTGDTGIIKVFRQDCAFAKRRHDSWETGSTFSRKLAAHGSGYVAGGGLGRSASILTRTSAGSTAHSRRGSLSQPVAPALLGGVATGSPQQVGGAAAHSDHRILSWRQGIVENGGVVDRRSVLIANGGGTPARSERSLSPTKASRTSLNSAYNLASEARKLPYAGAVGGGGVPSSPGRGRMGTAGTGSALTSPTASVFSSHAAAGVAAAREGSPVTRLVKAPARERRNSTRKDEQQQQQQQQEPSVPPTPGFTLRPANETATPDPTPPVDTITPSGGNTGASSFWNLGRWRGITGFRAASSSSQAPATATARARSSGSRPSLSKTRGLTDGEGEERGADGDAGDKGADNVVERASASRRQSLGVLPVKLSSSNSGGNGAATGGDAKAVVDRRASLPPAAAMLQERSDSDAYSVPVNSGVGEMEDGQTPLDETGRGQGDGVKNRRADWSRGHSHVSRLNAEMGS